MEFLDQYHGFLQEGVLWINLAILFVGAIALSFLSSPIFLWVIYVGVSGLLLGVPYMYLGAAVGVLLVFAIPPIRQILVTPIVFKIMKGFMPKISETERTALEAGVVWAEAELFSGNPNFKKLMNEPYPYLTEEEKAFVDGPVQELCEMIDDWKIWKERQVPEHIWQFIKDKKFLGMIVPKEYGGLGFSNLAHSEIIMKISSRSIATSISVMVPNSLGPAELLVHYGTQEQKDRYLKRLADGELLPCFGLTEPQAGSDAGSITSEGILFKNEAGKICVKLSWKKRWITLAAISDLIGLAFKLRDPENLLGRGEDLGITCALIPSETPGVVLGERHDPLGVPFFNCPTEGHDVVINAEEQIIGGLEGAGEGWQMLMESLGAGRGISLPAQSTGGLKLMSRLTTAHGLIRKQFGMPIGKFEGVEEPMARILGYNYLLEAMRRYTLSALDQGIKPPVVTAIAKFNATEIGRIAVNDAMDIMGGAGISLGPKNLIGIPYIAMPIGITVEGANILTRTLMIFGQGALRAHPYAFKEVNAVEKGDVKAFDGAFWGHIGHISANKSRSFVHTLTRGYLANRGYGKGMGRYFQKLAWASASFAFLADIAMGLLGGQLKIKEKLTGRFADILSWMYIGTAVLRKYEADGFRKEDAPFVHYSMQLALSKIQEAFDGIYANFDVPLLGWLYKGPIRWWSNINKLSEKPSDSLGHKLCKEMLKGGDLRDRMTEGLFIPKDEKDQLAFLDKTFDLVNQSAGIEKKIKKAIKSKNLPKKRIVDLIDLALGKNIISEEEKSILVKSEEYRWQAIQVDAFNESDYRSGGDNSYTKK